MRVVEVRWHRDHRTRKRTAERSLGALAQRLQDVGGDLHRAFHARGGANLQHARLVDEVVRCVLQVVDVLHSAAHEALHRDDGVVRVHGLVCLRGVAHLDFSIAQITHDGRQERPALRIGQHGGDATSHCSDERVGGAEVDAHRKAPLVRLGRLAGLGDLQQRHYSMAS